MKSIHKLPKSKLYNCSISLNFSNNDLRELATQSLNCIDIVLLVEELAEIPNSIEFCREREKSLVRILDQKTLTLELNTGDAFLYFDKMLEGYTQKVIIFYKIDCLCSNVFDLCFFLNTKKQIKTIMIANRNDLNDFISNYCISLYTKGEKSDITFYESKSVNLSAINAEKIGDPTSVAFAEQLMCIPGVSECKAMGILVQFKSIGAIIEFIKSMGKSDAIEMFSKIQVEYSKNALKPLGNSLACKIYKIYSEIDPEVTV
jgi:hypothetical protein